MDFRPFHFQIASLGRMNAGQPVKIGVASRLYRQDQKFRRLVGVQLAQTDSSAGNWSSEVLIISIVSLDVSIWSCQR